MHVYIHTHTHGYTPIDSCFDCTTYTQGDLSEDQERRLKQLLLVRKIYEKMLAVKVCHWERAVSLSLSLSITFAAPWNLPSFQLREDQKQCDRLEVNLQRVRQATGVSDVSEIAKKFLGRHITTENLLVWPVVLPLAAACVPARQWMGFFLCCGLCLDMTSACRCSH